MENVDNLVLKLFEIEALKFGSFTLKSGIQSPVYFDLRVIVSYPSLMNEVADFLWQAAEKPNAKFVLLCGVPYTALPLATIMSANHNVPMLIRRKEAKDYGTKKMIEGKFKPGDTCLIVEDVVTSGSSVMETADSLSKVGIVVTDAVVLLDREQGGKQRLEHKGINLYSVCGMSGICKILEKHGKLDSPTVKQVDDFLAKNIFKPDTSGVKLTEQVSKKSKKSLRYHERAEIVAHPLSKQLLKIMDSKQTNLAFSVDVTKCQQVLELVDKVGPHVCIVKTHVDIIEDFNDDFITALQKLADKHNFLIFEDRKFADIGNTVKHQYSSGVYKINQWAHITNAHSVPGDGVVQGLKDVGLPKNRGCLLIAEMSSTGNLATGEYTKATVKMAEEQADFVIGFICTSRLTDDPRFLHMTPGVQLSAGGDSLGQQYLTPNIVIGDRGSDIIIVGRGIYKADDPSNAAKLFKEAGYEAYLKQSVDFTITEQ
ncbi:uridine 5'-monophosphate synthase-like [Saccoglossus kowalevskii]|uniref:Uridine 5'-monophosphate synthase n=1 Tax=Saccoglossus kowalevskii TaxID=10224 RepID=A0ABM0GRR3_SACKO|nr:PREDICTED: uridine 5'-monophosphate synthase-like [Saccoglossus kowalevskii]